MQLDLHYTDPRLVDLYDIENPRGADYDFYLELAASIHAQRIVDLGCGTGLLTREMATDGRSVIGVDPAAAMLAYASRQPDAEGVEWVEGASSAIGRQNADLLIMTGNVAQVFLDNAEWAATLQDIHAALRSGGYLAFESRNPAARSWEQWNPTTTFQQMASPHGLVESWLEVVDVGVGTVTFRGHNRFTQTGETLVVDSQLRFRTQTEIRDSLADAGFVVENVYGGWQRQPVEDQSLLMVFVASRA